MSNEREVTLSRGQVEMSRGNKKKKIIFFKDLKVWIVLTVLRGQLEMVELRRGSRKQVLILKTSYIFELQKG